MSLDPATPLLDCVPTPVELRQLAPGQLPQLAAELRAEMIAAEALTVPLKVDIGTGRNWDEAH